MWLVLVLSMLKKGQGLLSVHYQVLVRADFDGTVESVLGSALVSDSPAVKLNLAMVKTISVVLLIIN